MSLETSRYLIFHGCPPTEAMVSPLENRWMNWIANELKKRGLDAEAPQLPTPWMPKYAEWRAKFEELQLDRNTVVAAHSCSAAAIVRYLLEKGLVLKKLILVAPAKVPETDDDPRQDLYHFDLPTEVPHLAEELVLFTSNDFPHHLESRELYIQALVPSVIELENKGHFLFYQMGNSPEFQELLQEILRTGSIPYTE